MEVDISELEKQYGIQSEEQFEEYFNEVKGTLTAGKEPDGSKTLVIVGGQSGAGKTRLVTIAKKELPNSAIVVDFDELRAHHPSYKDVYRDYPEITYKILQRDTDRVKEAIMDYLVEHGYSVIYEGALRNTQGFLDLAKPFVQNDYNINLKVMAVHNLESYGSTLIRYTVALMTECVPRWVEKQAHDASYEGTIRTTQEFIKRGIAKTVDVYVRGDEQPRKIYSTGEGQFPDAITAIKYGRESGRSKAVSDFEGKFVMVRDVLQQKQPELLDKLSDWVQLYEEEKRAIDSSKQHEEI